MSTFSMSERAVFATKFGAVATTVGSAVGLGNIWRFPYEAGVHGGGAFLICYLIFVFIIGIPVLCAEFAVGRYTRSNIFGAYRKLSPVPYLHFAGLIGIIASILIISFYSVVAGWTVEYFLYSLGGSLDFSSSETGHLQFQSLTTGLNPLIWTVVFLIFNFLILVGGVRKGIEKASNILMPILFLLLIAFCINSFQLPGFSQGMEFLFKPDFTKLSASVILGALGQAFFSLSLGLGCMMTYASYFRKDTILFKTALTTSMLDSMVAIIAGIIIFPAVFSFNISPEAGPTLVFEVLPYIFNQLPGGAIWSSLFFFLLFVASLTSTVSMSEIPITYFCEEKKMSRSKATIMASLIALVGGIICALSFGPLGNFLIFNMNIFNLFDYVSSNVCLPLGGFICSILVGWLIQKNVLSSEFNIKNSEKAFLYNNLIFCLKWICPLAIFLIFLNSIGII